GRGAAAAAAGGASRRSTAAATAGAGRSAGAGAASTAERERHQTYEKATSHGGPPIRHCRSLPRCDVAYWGDHEQRWPLPPATIRPFTAMGEVQRWMLEQLPLLTISAPVSPSTPFKTPPLVNQTIGFDIPSVVVAIGPV